MSPEMIAIIAVGVALAGLMLRGQHGLDRRVDELRNDIARLDDRLRAVETGLAEVKGQLAIVRDYIRGRNAPSIEASETPAE